MKVTSVLIDRRTAIAGLAALVLGLSACGGGSSSASTAASGGTPDYGALSVQLSWIKNVEFGGEYQADSKGYYKDAGFSSTNLVAGPGATETLVASGKALVGVSDPISASAAITKQQAPLKIIGTTYQKNPFSILSLQNKGNITTPQDMIGKKIGVQSGNEALFKALLAVNNIPESEVKIVPVQYDPSVLTNGEVDGYLAYVTNESITLQLRGFKVTNLPFADNGLKFMTESYEVAQDSIDNHRAELEAFLYATIKGWKDQVADPASGVDLALKTYGKDLSLDEKEETEQATAANKLIVNSDTDKNGLLTMSQEAIDASLATLKAAGTTITADQLFDTSLIADVYKAHPELLK
jgi:ABC-type nitrate/sulfonate/bicarbonate transport system substrate-binding protein